MKEEQLTVQEFVALNNLLEENGIRWQRRK